MNEFLQGNSCANHVITQVLYAPKRAGSSAIGTNSDTFSSAQNQLWAGHLLCSRHLNTWCELTSSAKEPIFGSDYYMAAVSWLRSLRDSERIVQTLQMTESSYALRL